MLIKSFKINKKLILLLVLITVLLTSITIFYSFANDSIVEEEEIEEKEICSGILKVPNRGGRGLVLLSPCGRQAFSFLGVPLFSSFLVIKKVIKRKICIDKNE